MVIIAQFENINTNVTKHNTETTSVRIHSKNHWVFFPPHTQIRSQAFKVSSIVIGLAQMGYFYFVPSQSLIVV